MLGCAEMLFCPQAMPTHIAVVGCASSFHLLDRFLHMVLASLQVMLVMNPLGRRRSRQQTSGTRKERQLQPASSCFFLSIVWSDLRVHASPHRTSTFGQSETSTCPSVTTGHLEGRVFAGIWGWVPRKIKKNGTERTIGERILEKPPHARRIEIRQRIQG